MLRSSALRCFSICTRLALFRISGREKTIFRPIFYLYLLRLNSFGRCWPNKVPSLHLVDLNLNSISSLSVIFVDMWRWWLVEVKLSKVCTAALWIWNNKLGWSESKQCTVLIVSFCSGESIIPRHLIYFHYHAGWWTTFCPLVSCINVINMINLRNKEKMHIKDKHNVSIFVLSFHWSFELQLVTMAREKRL